MQSDKLQEAEKYGLWKLWWSEGEYSTSTLSISFIIIVMFTLDWGRHCCNMSWNTWPRVYIFYPVIGSTRELQCLFSASFYYCKTIVVYVTRYLQEHSLNPHFSAEPYKVSCWLERTSMTLRPHAPTLLYSRSLHFRTYFLFISRLTILCSCTSVSFHVTEVSIFL